MTSDMDLNLGRCHYGDFDEEAVAVAARPDGGWVAVCEEHKERAAEEGYEVREPVAGSAGTPDAADDADASGAG